MTLIYACIASTDQGHAHDANAYFGILYVSLNNGFGLNKNEHNFSCTF